MSCARATGCGGLRYLIDVRSDDPRKNLATLLRALAEAARCALPDVRLIKVGRAHFAAERTELLALASAWRGRCHPLARRCARGRFASALQLGRRVRDAVAV